MRIIIAALLIVLGVVALSYQSITFFTHETVANAGPFTFDVAKPHTIFFNPIVGVICLIVGAVLLLAGRRTDTL